MAIFEFSKTESMLRCHHVSKRSRRSIYKVCAHTELCVKKFDTQICVTNPRSNIRMAHILHSRGVYFSRNSSTIMAKDEQKYTNITKNGNMVQIYSSCMSVIYLHIFATARAVLTIQTRSQLRLNAVSFDFGNSVVIHERCQYEGIRKIAIELLEICDDRLEYVGILGKYLTNCNNVQSIDIIAHWYCPLWGKCERC